MTRSYVSDYLNATQTKTWAIIGSDYSASSGDKLLVDTSIGSVIITLPANPVIGTTVEFSDASDFSAPGKPLIVTTGSLDTIQGQSEDLLVDTKNASFALTFNGNNDWRLTET